MTPARSHVLGRPVWFELMTTDTRAAEAFYDKVVGWTSEPFGASPNPYTQFKRSGGVAVAGLMERPDGMNMPDINAATERIKANGGKILNGPMEVPGGDWIVNAMDPQGASFALHFRKTA
jgi:predicted enzyme related to lactoylglutathione lyase